MAALLGSVRSCLRCGTHLNLPKYGNSSNVFVRGYADLVVNHKWDLDPRVRQQFEDTPMKHRTHPGVVSVRKVQLPNRLRDSLNLLMERYPTKDLTKNSEDLAAYLWSRQKPVESDEIQSRAEAMEVQIMEKEKIDTGQMTEEEKNGAAAKIRRKVIKSLKQHCFHWKPIEYDAYKGFLYLVGRISADYSSLYQIFSEIAQRDPTFQPSTLFDFGSGVGSAMWAANSTWNGCLREHYCVDSSNDMNTIARLLVQDGDEEKESCIPGVYFRQHMPVSYSKKYNVVVSAFSLMELPTQQDRLNTLYGLWRRTEDYLVIVENGTNAGFLTTLEARDFILQFRDNEVLSEQEEEELKGYVFSPCPHDSACPRMLRSDGTPCNFNVSYKPLDSKPGSETKKVNYRYSYVVLRKGSRPPGLSWPRVVREPSNPSKRVHLRTCAPNGELQVSILTAAKHGRDLYWCGRACKWGDLLPVVPPTETNETKPGDTSSHKEFLSDDQSEKRAETSPKDSQSERKQDLSQINPLPAS